MRLADLSRDGEGGKSQACRERALVYVDTVNAQKSGAYVPLDSILHINCARPDFMRSTGRGNYKSERALGQLFRAIPSIETSAAVAQRDFSADSTSMQLVALRKQVLARARSSFGFRPERIGLDDLEAAPRLRQLYCAQLREIGVICNYPRRLDVPLSEVEMALGSIGGESTTTDQRGAKIASQCLKVKMKKLVEAVERELVGDRTLGGRFTLAWACWSEALEAEEGEYGVKMWRWLLALFAMEWVRRIEEQGPMWKEEQKPKVVVKQPTFNDIAEAPPSPLINRLSQRLHPVKPMPEAPTLTHSLDTPSTTILSVPAPTEPPQPRRTLAGLLPPLSAPPAQLLTPPPTPEPVDRYVVSPPPYVSWPTNGELVTGEEGG